MRLKALTLFGAALLALGCQSDDGGQSGDFSGDDGGEGPNAGGSNCKDTETPIDPADDSQLGFSGDDLAALVDRSFTSQVTWRPLANVGYAPGSGSSELTLQATPTGQVWYVTSEPKEDDSGINIGVLCPPPRLRLGVDVLLSTSEGALAEAFSGKVEGSSKIIASLSHRFDLEAIAGSFAIESLPEGGKVLGLGLDATLSGAGMTGSLSSLLEITYAAGDPLEGAVSAQPLVFASWPDSETCPADQSGASGIPVGVDDEALGLSAAAAIERYNAATPVTVHWQDGSESELTLTATAAGDGCMRLNPYAYTPQDPEAMVVYPVTLTAVSEDGALDGSYQAKLTTSLENGSDEQRVLIEVSLPLELDQLSQSGLTGVTLPAGLHRLFYTLSSEVEAGAAHGLLELNGLTDPPCVTDPPEPDPDGMGAPGCMGTQVTELASGTWGKGTVD